MSPRRTQPLILCYHAVSEAWPAALAIPPDALERQLQMFLRGGFRPLTFLEALKYTGSERTMAVTFDDAFRSVYELALPILAGLGVPGTVFAPTAHIGQVPPRGWDGTSHWLDSDWAAELTQSSWDELRALVVAGWEVGSHTRDHPHLPMLDDADLVEELEASRRDLEEKLGAPCRSLAYPYGESDQRVRDAAREAGYEAATALSDRLPLHSAAVDEFRWPRLAIYRGDSGWRLEAKTRLFRGSPRGWNAMQSLRRRRSARASANGGHAANRGS